MTVEHGQYLLVMLACLLITLPLEFFGSRVYRTPGRAAKAIVPVALVYLIWDGVAIAASVWTFSPRYITGWTVLGIPVEEIVFFVVISLCALLTYEAVEALLQRVSRRRRPVSDKAVRS